MNWIWKQNMASSSDLNVIVDVVVPTVFVIAIFVINGFVLRMILRRRREYVDVPQVVQQEMGTIRFEEPTTSNLAPQGATAPVAHAEEDEIERL